jgi:hypothetical protein
MFTIRIDMNLAMLLKGQLLFSESQIQSALNNKNKGAGKSLL